MTTRRLGTWEERGTGAPTAPGPLSRPSVPAHWRLRSRTLNTAGPLVMGILNLTPDSFSDGGDLGSVRDAMDRALTMIHGGAEILDVGGESTRPGALEVSPGEEAARVLPFLKEAVQEISVPLSIDTRKAAVAEVALDAGVEIVNDVSGMRHDREMAGLAARYGAGVVLSHMRGTPATMTGEAEYGEVVGDVISELEESLGLARRAGIEWDRIVVDPGLGFAKTRDHNLTILARLGELGILGRPVLVGPSRKRFIGALTGVPEKERVHGTVAACVVAYLQGARIFRVHDVEPVVQALTVTRAMVEAAE